MTDVEIPRRELGRTEAFLSYDTLAWVNSIDSGRQFRYAQEQTFTPSATFHNGALMLGLGPSAEAICAELRERGYIGLVEIEHINPREGVNQIRGRPLVRA